MPRKTAAQKAAERAAEAAKAEAPPLFALPQDLAQAILNFLLTCEAGKVIGLIDGLRQLQTVEISEPDDEEPEAK